LPFHAVSEASQNPALFVAAFWSLNYEEQFYLVMAIAMLLTVRFRVSVTRTVLALFALGLAWNIATPGGWIIGLFIEYWTHFALGSLLFFVLCVYTTRRVWLAFVAGLLLLIAFCCWNIWPWQGLVVTETQSRAYLELVVVSIICLVLMLLRPVSDQVSRSLWWRPIALLGTISYSLYLVHQFNLTLVDTIVSHVLSAAVPHFLSMTFAALLHIFVGAGFWLICERPFLNKPINRSGVQVQA
jgi:peptidoglycan/LPS O-acetylase OafA/YrhL